MDPRQDCIRQPIAGASRILVLGSSYIRLPPGASLSSAGILYARSLIDGSRWWWLGLALICLTREEGPLFAWSIHVLVWLLARERPDAAEGAYSKRLLVGLVRISLGYLVLFGAGMGLILANRGLGSARLGQAMGDLSDMLTVGVLGQYLLINFSLCGVLVAPW